jgi:hypothetical protein
MNKVIHILHNCGGGIEVYVDNIISILSEYEHIKIKIINSYLYLVNDVLVENIKDIFDDVKKIFVHHLLYIEESKFKINMKILEFIKGLEIKKIFIVHDFHLLYPNKIFPIELNLEKPNISDLLLTKYVFNIFDIIYFNSKSCFLKYNNYIYFNNFIILKNVPDINIFNPRIYKNLINKKVYNVGILGNICHEHKGKSLAESIFKIVEYNYNFKIFGNYTSTESNVISFGTYDNNSIFDLIKREDIDFFIFVSRFAETYSYCLSIAIKTGLPIIYNNIGAYHDRLSKYDNCYPFNELDINIIPRIFDEIVNNTNFSNENEDYSYSLIENLPEFKI